PGHWLVSSAAERRDKRRIHLATDCCCLRAGTSRISSVLDGSRRVDVLTHLLGEIFPSRDRLPNDDRSGREDTRTMLVVGDSPDSTVCADFNLDDSGDLPRATTGMQEHDAGLIIDVPWCQPPRDGHA